MSLPPPADPTPQTSGVPAGWYPDPGNGQQRWWDGQQWTTTFAQSAPVERAGNPAAVAGLVVGLLTLVFMFFVPAILLYFAALPGIIAFALGMDGLKRSRKVGNGRGMAVAAIVLGVIVVGWSLVTFLRVAAAFG